MIVKQNKIPLKCYYVLVYIFHCPLYYNLNVLGEPNNMNYLPSWEDLDTRPLPQWYDSSKIGILVDWGVQSVPSLEDEFLLSTWKNGAQETPNHLKANYSRTIRRYEDFAPTFKANKFDPEQWAKLFVKSGARYVVVTAKYKDGFTLFPSYHPKWNSVEIGPKKDIVHILSQSIKRHGMKFGVYYSLTEWFNKLFIDEREKDNKKDFTTAYIDTIIMPEIKFLLDQYEPSVLWVDGDDDVRCSSYWKSTEMLAWIYNESPVKDEIVVNDRLSSCTRCLHGDFFSSANCYNDVIQHKWENPVRLDKGSRSYIREKINSEDVLSFIDMVETVVSTVSRGGNVLIVVGPSKAGIIAPAFQGRLQQLGAWLESYAEAIYNTSRWIHQKDSSNPNVWYTCTTGAYRYKEGMVNASIHTIRTVYVIFLKWPDDDVLKIADLIHYIMEEEIDISFIIANTGLAKHSEKQKKKTMHEIYIPLSYVIGNSTLEVHLPSIKHKMVGWVLKVDFKDFALNSTFSNYTLSSSN